MKNHKAKILTAVFSLFALVIVSLIALSPSALADGEYDEAYLLRKALMNDIYTCYNDGHVRTSIGLSDFNSLGSIANNDKDGLVKLPNGFTNINDNDLSCEQLFNGYPSGSDGTTSNTFAGVTAYSNGFQRITANSSTSEKVNALTALGYTADSNSALSSQCMYITYAVSQTDQNGIYQGSGSFRTNQACAYVDSNGNVTSNDNGETLFINDSGSTTLDGNVPLRFYIDGDYIVLENASSGVNQTAYCSSEEAEMSFSSCVSPVDKNKPGSFNIISGQYWTTTLSDAVVSTNTQSASPTVYSMPTPKPDVAVDSLFGDHAQRYMSVPEVASLYQIYLNKYADVQCTTDSTTAQSLTGAGYSGPFKAIKDGAYVEGCYAKISSGNGTFNGYVSSTWGTAVSLQNIIDYLNSNNVATGLASSVVSINAGDASGEIVDPNNAGNEGGSSNCYDSASALGWILCPIIEATANAVNGLYENIIEPFLSINAETFNTGSGVYQAWQLFQSFANIVFVILFLVTIFSQLTGFGIDNLGIKRLLPKLIIAAILVNLSYIICQALVDLSNIIGYGANHLFDNITINGENGVSTGQSAITSLISLLGLGGTATIATATAPIWGPTMIIPIVLTLVSLLIGLVFAFVLLGVRQAGVIILVFIAPVAFVLYMLPNTKPIFDKWKKAFTGLLLLYPICGLLMGGSKFAGNVLISTSKSFWVAAIGSLLSVIVFFFIPSLVRNSMTAVGNVGARISNLGQNLSRGAQQRVSNSQLAQDHMKRVAAGIDRNGNVTGRGRLMNRIANGESRFSRVPGVQRMASRSLARGRAAYVRDMQDQMNEARLNDPQFLENYQRQQQMAIEKESLQTEMDILKKDTNNGEIETNAKGTGLFDLYDQAIASGNIVRARAVAELAGRRKDTASRFAEHVKMGTATGAYDGAEGQNILAAVAKQISTGDNSKNYRAGNATGFEFASNINNGQATSTNYADWVANEDNINRVLENHITNNEELYGQSRSVLRELAGTPKQSNGATLYTPNISSDNRTYVSELAKYAEQQSKIGGAYDRTKDREMEALRNLASSSNNNSGNNNSNAAPGQTFNVNNPQNNPSQTSGNQSPTNPTNPSSQ